MAKRISAGLVAIALTSILCVSASGADPTPEILVKKVVGTYKNLQTYKSEGTVLTDMTVRDTTIKLETTFSILLKKPNLYLISWSQKNAAMPIPAQSGTVWNDGEQPRLHMAAANAYYEIDGDSMALAAATGLSGGAAYTIPSLFLPAFDDIPDHFARMENLKIEPSQQIAGEDCYVLSGSSRASKKETFWISKASHLIRKYRRKIEPRDEEDQQIPELTDKQIDQAIEATGAEATDQARQDMRRMLEDSRQKLKTEKIRGTFVEIHATISSPESDKRDFEFVPPRGTVLKDSLLDTATDGN